MSQEFWELWEGLLKVGKVARIFGEEVSQRDEFSSILFVATEKIVIFYLRERRGKCATDSRASESLEEGIKVYLSRLMKDCGLHTPFDLRVISQKDSWPPEAHQIGRKSDCLVGQISLGLRQLKLV